MSRFRWIVVFLLFSITVVNYIDRAAIAYALPQMQKALGLSAAESGTVLGIFGLGYAATTLLGGFAVDRWGARRVLTVAALLWSLSIGLTGLAGGVALLYVARLLLGVSEGPMFPSMSGAVTQWLPPQERATAIGNALVAVPLALAIGGPAVTQLLAVVGWRDTFGLLFAVSALWVPLWFLLFRDRPEQSRSVDAAELAYIRGDDATAASAAAARHSWPSGAEMRRLLANRTLLANTWAFFVFGYFLFFFMTWLPTYLHDRFGLDLRAVGLFTMLPWLVGAVSLYTLSRTSDRLLVRTGRLRLARSWMIAATQAVAALAVVPLAFGSDLPAVIAALTVAVSALMGANAAYSAVNVDIVPARAATALGMMEFAFALSGFIAPVLTGWVLHLGGSFEAAFLLMAGLAASSVLVVVLFHHPDSDRIAA